MMHIVETTRPPRTHARPRRLDSLPHRASSPARACLIPSSIPSFRVTPRDVLFVSLNQNWDIFERNRTPTAFLSSILKQQVMLYRAPCLLLQCTMNAASLFRNQNRWFCRVPLPSSTKYKPVILSIYSNGSNYSTSLWEESLPSSTKYKPVNHCIYSNGCYYSTSLQEESPPRMLTQCNYIRIFNTFFWKMYSI